MLLKKTKLFSFAFSRSLGHSKLNFLPRKSIFHDKIGNRLDIKLAHHFFISLFSVVCKAINIPLERPWFPINAVKKLDSIIDKNFTIFEYGSGISSFWFAKRSKAVYSVENNRDFYHFMNDEIRMHSVKNISIVCNENIEEYTNSPIKSDVNFDLVVIDGINRNKCINVAKSLNPIYIYIDDCDQPDINYIVNNTDEIFGENSKIWVFVDFVYHNCSVRQSILVKLR